jgi:IS30 family transposase
MREPRPRLTMQQRRRLRELRREGLKLREIVAELGCSRQTVARVLRRRPSLGELGSLSPFICV